MFDLNVGSGIRFFDKICIDPKRKPSEEIVVISHAHSDHSSAAKSNKSKYVLSKATYDLLERKFELHPNVQKASLNSILDFEDFELSLHNSGHILGSSQTQIISKKTGKKTIITGDLKLQDSLIQKKADVLDSDFLVIESTFGLPKYVFPEREQIYNEIGKWIKQEVKNRKFVILCGYSLGKAQELTKIVNEFTDETPLVHEKAFGFNQIYEKYLKLGDYMKLDHNLKDSNVLIMPPNLASPTLQEFLHFHLNKKISSAIATGWNFNRRLFDRTFPLSDHADCQSLLEYVEQSNPKFVYTMHGYEKEFAYLINKKLGIPAQPLKELKQKSLGMFS